MTSQTGQQIVSRSKSNQEIKFGELIEYKMRNIFLEELYTKCGGEASSGPFYKRSNLSISVDQQPKML